MRRGNVRKLLIVTLFMLVSSLLPPSAKLFGQESSEPEIVFHVTAVRQSEVHEHCSSSDCRETRFTVEGYSVGNSDSHSTEYVLECDQFVPNKPSSDSVLVKCARLHAGNDYEARLGSLPESEGMSFGPGLIWNIVSEKEVNKQGRDATPCSSKRAPASPTRPK